MGGITACRLPGGVDSPSSFWDMMVFKRSGHCDIPEDRWNAMPFYNPKSSHPGGIITTEGYFLQDDICTALEPPPRSDTQNID